MTPPNDPLSESARRHRATDDKCALCLHTCADGCPFESKLDAINKKMDDMMVLVVGGSVKNADALSVVERLRAVENKIKAATWALGIIAAVFLAAYGNHLIKALGG